MGFRGGEVQGKAEILEARGRATALTVRMGPLVLALLPLVLTACGEDEGVSTKGATERSRQLFGSEVTSAEAHQAEAALRGYLEARAEARWARACTYLTDPIRRLLAQAAARYENVLGASCPGFIASSTRKLPVPERAALDRVAIDSVRADGDRGYVLYETLGDDERAIRIQAEGGRWKLAAVNGTSLAAS